MMGFDTLRAAHRLRDEAGFDETQATVLVLTFAEGFAERFPTKADLQEVDTSVRVELKRVEASIRGDMEKMETSIRGDMEKMETSIRGDMEKMETSLRSDMGKIETSVRTGLRDLENRMTIRMGGLMVIGIGVLLSLQRFLS
ncbi:MAG: hypothetical protein F4068_09950 [Gemmatimonadetes bacterium]|nr:hypothetical protein [Gemmatimonadota bacterium]MYJ39117.1 hypothetical protein [Gemmatimonadota bacterium]